MATPAAAAPLSRPVQIGLSQSSPESALALRALPSTRTVNAAKFR